MHAQARSAASVLRLPRALVLLMTTASLVACDTQSATETEAAGLVPPGKADDFFSTDAMEYTVEGRIQATIDDACLERNADSPDPQRRCAEEIIGLENFAVAWFLNTYIIDKHDAPNEQWGGFTGMTRPASYEALDVGEVADGAFEYTFTSELSGPVDLLSLMPTTPCSDDPSARCFELEIPVVPNDTLRKMDTGDEWYRDAPYSAYAPELYEGEKEVLELRITPYERSNDAFLEYDKLFAPEQLAKADGALKIGLFVGWDYYDARYDLLGAEATYDHLTRDLGLQSPVDTFDDYGIDSGSFTGEIEVQGKTVPVDVILVHPGQGDPADPVFAGSMKDQLVKAFAERQVIAFEGHAGPLYGFALANWRETEAGELDDSELPFLDVQDDFYQVVMVSGCDTYMVADSLYQIPAKTGRTDLDVITTSTFSNAANPGRTTASLLQAVMNQQGPEGELEPLTYGWLIRELNRDMWSPLFGVHGIDDNPRSNPLADTSVACEPCISDEDCGGNGNMCVQINDTQTVCTTLCQSDADCNDSETCYDVTDGTNIIGSQCIPTSLSC